MTPTWNHLKQPFINILSMVVSGSRKKVGSVAYNPPGKDYKWYISGIFPANWGIICHMPPHLLRERETTIKFINWLFQLDDSKSLLGIIILYIYI